MNRKEIKKEAKKCLKNNYWRSVAVVFFIAFIMGSFNIFTKNHFRLSSLEINPPITSSVSVKIINPLDYISFNPPSRGVMANIFQNISNSGSFIFGFLNSLNELIFHNHIWKSVIFLTGAILSFLYWYLIRNVLIVGKKRFFLENKNHKKTHLTRILLPFKVRKEKNVSLVMFIKILKEYLWWITIIGGFIKHYSYYLVPYILAENPNIAPKDALKLSSDLTNGHKWELFKFDISFLGYYLLDILTMRFLGILFVSPYKECCLSEYYFNLKNIGIKNKINNINLLNDLELNNVEDTYPSHKYLYEEKNFKKWLNTDYNKSYSLDHLILMFFTAAIIGWIWEVGLNLFQYGFFANRGTLYGPWLQIYGWGLLFILLSLKKFRDKPILTFFLVIIMCGIIEYTGAWYLETFKHARWWDYDGFFLNLHGRICFEGLIAFGIAGTFFIYFAAPFLDSLFIKIPKNIKLFLCILLCFLFAIDFIYSSSHPNTGNGVAEALITKKNTMEISEIS